jgi:putative transposase
MEKAKTANRYRLRYVRVQSEWYWSTGRITPRSGAAIGSIAAKIGCTGETLRGCVRQAERDQGLRVGQPAMTVGASRPWNARCANCARPMRSCARRRRILRWRSSTADPSHDRLHRRSSRCLQGRADLPGLADPLGWLSTCNAGGTFATLAPSTYHTHAAKGADPGKRSARAKRDASLQTDIKRIWDANFQVYGVRKVWRQLQPEPGSAGPLRHQAPEW